MIATVIPNSPPTTWMPHWITSAYGIVTATIEPVTPVTPLAIISLLLMKLKI